MSFALSLLQSGIPGSPTLQHCLVQQRVKEKVGETLLGNNFSPTSLSTAVRTSHASCRSSTPKRFHPYMSPHLFPCLFSSSRCILLSVISNRLKVTAAALHRSLTLSHSRSLSLSLSLFLTHTHTHIFTHTDTHTLVCKAPSGLKVLSQSSGVTTAVKLPISPAKVALSHVSQQSPSFLSLFLAPFTLPSVHQPLTDTIRHTLSHTLRTDTALSYSVAVKEGAEPIAAEGSVLLHSSQLRLERGHPFRKKRGGKKEGEREEEKK